MRRIISDDSRALPIAEVCERPWKEQVRRAELSTRAMKALHDLSHSLGTKARWRVITMSGDCHVLVEPTAKAPDVSLRRLRKIVNRLSLCCEKTAMLRLLEREYRDAAKFHGNSRVKRFDVQRKRFRRGPGSGRRSAHAKSIAAALSRRRISSDRCRRRPRRP